MGVVGRWLREPLLHFVVLGAVVFALHRLLAPPAPSRQIVVTEALRRGMRQEHLRRQGAAPTAAEEDAIIQRYVDTEVMVREALALGLDRGDIIVRRRLVQKMEFLNEGLEPISEPTDADLQAYLDAHEERYALAERVSLEHVFVSASGHPIDGEAVAVELREQLLAGADPARLGEPFLRGREFRGQSERDLAAIFGPAFARAVVGLRPEEWSKPVASSYGLHLVRVSERQAGHRPALDAVRREVRRDWQEERRDAAARAAFHRLRERYDIRIEEAP